MPTVKNRVEEVVEDPPLEEEETPGFECVRCDNTYEHAVLCECVMSTESSPHCEDCCETSWCASCDAWVADMFFCGNCDFCSEEANNHCICDKFYCEGCYAYVDEGCHCGNSDYCASCCEDNADDDDDDPESESITDGDDTFYHCNTCGQSVSPCNFVTKTHQCKWCAPTPLTMLWVCRCCQEHMPEGATTADICSECSTCLTCCPVDGKHVLSEHPPWVDRGLTIDLSPGTKVHKVWDPGASNWKSLWGFDSKTLYPSRAMASFYLLFIMEHRLGIEPGAPVKDLADKAKEMRAALVAEYEPPLRAYVAMAVWGEARYHRALKRGYKAPNNRTTMWAAGRYVEDTVGREQVYADLNTLFNEMPRGSVGGPKWGLAAKVLHQRYTGLLTPELFLDRVFAMQHNGGSLLNKVMWGREGEDRIERMASAIGPAHSADPPNVDQLCRYCSEEVRELWASYDEVAQRFGGLVLSTTKSRPSARCSLSELLDKATDFVRESYRAGAPIPDKPRPLVKVALIKIREQHRLIVNEEMIIVMSMDGNETYTREDLL